MEQEYFDQINGLIKGLEIKKKVRDYSNNSDTLITYWTVGKLLIEAQGDKRAIYGNELVKKWSEILIERYGKGYDYTNLQRFKQFYIEFPIVGPLGQQFISWTHIRHILPIKNEIIKNKSLKIDYFNLDFIFVKI